MIKDYWYATINYILETGETETMVTSAIYETYDQVKNWLNNFSSINPNTELQVWHNFELYQCITGSNN